MDENRMRVLKMVEDGKVTPEDGARLLAAIQGKEQERAIDTPASTGRCFRVRICEGDMQKPKVNVTVPLALAKLALRFIPRSVLEELNEDGIKVEDLDQIISSVESAGPFRIVDVQDGDAKIEVFVE